MSAPAKPYCVLHHCTPEHCPPLAPELGDLLPDLVRRKVDIRLIPAPTRIERCEDCPEAGVAVLAHLTPSESLPEGYVARRAYCAAHLLGAVTWQLRLGATTWLEIAA